MNKPADLGPQIDPQTVIIGKEYYWLKRDINQYVKGKITRRVDSTTLREPYYWLYFKEVDKEHPNVLGINPSEPWMTYYHKFFKVRDSAQIQAQTNVLRNLGTYGKVTMDIALNVLPAYLGLGGSKSRTKRHPTNAIIEAGGRQKIKHKKTRKNRTRK